MTPIYVDADGRFLPSRSEIEPEHQDCDPTAVTTEMFSNGLGTIFHARGTFSYPWTVRMLVSYRFPYGSLERFSICLTAGDDILE
jgi:hypothetical protein